MIIPLMTLIYSILLRNAEGPFYLNTLYDPTYVYLISSLNLSQLQAPAFVDHPGTPIHVIGAVIVKGLYELTGNSPDIAEDVLSKPEYYIRVMHFFLVLILCISLFLSSKIIYNSSKNIWLSCLFQLSIFTSYTTSYELSVIAAEIFLIPLEMFLLAYTIKYISDKTNINNNYYVFVFSIICGLGIATKLSFFPVVCIPLIILDGYRKKGLFLIFSIVFFIISLLPAISNFTYLVNWIKRIFIFDGLHGKGNPGIVNFENFLTNLEEIFFAEIYFSISFILILITIIISLFFRFEPKFKIILKFLYAVFVLMTLQTIIVSKHYSLHYIVPALILSIPGIYLCILVWANLKPEILKKFSLNYIFVFLILFTFSYTVISTINNLKKLSGQKDQALKLIEFIEASENGQVVISSYGSSSKEYGLSFSTIWAGKQQNKYREIINRLYPNNLYFEYWSNKIYSLSKRTNLKDYFHLDNKIIFLNSFEKSNEQLINYISDNLNMDVQLSKIYSSMNGESVYEIKIK